LKANHLAPIALEKLSKTCVENIPVKLVITNRQLINFVWEMVQLGVLVRVGPLTVRLDLKIN
jgi:hypothetical protein